MGDRRPSGATSSASIPTRPSATLPYGPPSSTACRPSSSRATRRWSAIPATSASSPPRAAVTSRSIRLGSPRMPASTASMCWPPIPSFPPCRWRWPIASCGKWNRSSERQRRSWRRGRSIISATPLSSATCFAPSSRWCCARHSTNGSRPPAPSWNGATSSATSTGSRRSLSIREPSASCYAPSHQAMPGSSARLSASPCRPWYARSRRLGRRHSPAHPRRAADGPAVVPRGPDFPELSHQINKFAIRGVELQSSDPLIKLSAEIYTTIFRGLPELLTLFLVYYGAQFGFSALSKLILGYAVEINPFLAGMVALGLVSSSYASETFLSAFRGITFGQYEGAYAVGLSRYLTLRLVIVPQLLRLALPGLSNMWLNLMKDTALVSVITLNDLLRITTVAVGATKQPFFFYTVACLIYLLFSMLSSIGIWRIDAWASRGVKPR